jgi:hypothetical protein
MFGSYQIQATTPDDLSDLSRFLIEGFGEPEDIPYFSAEVLRWKYFETCGVEFGPRSYVARAGSRIVGHAGIVPRLLAVRDAGARDSLTALHFIDLLAAPAYPTAGLMLMKRGFRATDVQYAMGGSADGQRMAEATGYELRLEFPRNRAILRPLHRLRGPGPGWLDRISRAGWDLTRYLAQPCRRARRTVRLQPVSDFGREVETLVDGGPSPLAFTTRSAGVLNYYLRYPRGAMSGWLVHDDTRAVGFALLNIPTGRDVREGKIVECFLASRDDELWHAAIRALGRELKRQGAEVALCYASTPWLERACHRAGFLPFGHPQQFYLRDDGRRLPAGVPIHLSFLEADHSYI